MDARYIRTRVELWATLLLCLTACHERTSPVPSAAATAREPTQAQPSTPASGETLVSPPLGPTAVQLDAAKRRALLDGITRELDAHYVFPEVATKMRAALQARAAAGDYDHLSDGPAFARTVTEHLREVSPDAHLWVEFGRPGANVLPMTPQAIRERNFGFGALDYLSGDVARLAIRGFTLATDPEVREGIGRLMSRVADARALIIDLRDNSGGEPATVAFVASYLFDETPVHLNDIYRRDDDSTQEFWTAPEVPGKRFGGQKPVYVLTNKRTFSGGEDLAYSLQAIKRARVVGEQTRGGANPCDAFPLDESFFIVVPWGRAINPVTKTNWEGVGVTPDIAVPEERALETAHRLAIADLTARNKR
jgi:retinol-binding protein 3